MSPVYFPFTYISTRTASAVSAYFPKIAVYQPLSGCMPEDMKHLAENRAIDIRVPVSGGEDMIKSICKQFREWWTLHEGSEIQFLKTQADIIPFFDDTCATHIRSDIREKMASEQKGSHDSQLFDPVLRARVFLQLTQEYDTASTELHQNLSRYNAMGKELFADMKGESDHLFSHPAEKNTTVSNDYGSYMTEARIAAWATLMRHDPAMPNIFITGSRAVLDHLLDNSTEAKKILEIYPEPPAAEKNNTVCKTCDDLMPYLKTLAKTGAPEQAERVCLPLNNIALPCSLDFYLVPGESPHRFFARFIKIKSTETGKTELNHTLIGHMNIHS